MTNERTNEYLTNDEVYALAKDTYELILNTFLESHWHKKNNKETKLETKLKTKLHFNVASADKACSCKDLILLTDCENITTSGTKENLINNFVTSYHNSLMDIYNSEDYVLDEFYVKKFFSKVLEYLDVSKVFSYNYSEMDNHLDITLNVT